MNALVKKEIRLLLPSWLAVLSLALFLPWFLMSFDAPVEMILISAFFGVILLGVDSFGREFTLGTFQSLLAQPVDRRRIWRIKISVLFLAAVLTMAGFFISYTIAYFTPFTLLTWQNYPALILRNVMTGMIIGGVVMLMALVGGLWTTLLLRQVAASFWITFLAPGALMMLVYLFIPSKLAENEHVVFSLFCGVAVVYIIAGFWLAHRLFHRAQDVAWTGGVISLANWRYFEAGSTSSRSTRHWKPFRALLKKEFQLHSIAFFCAAALLVLHIGIFFLRIFYASSHRNSVADVISDCFWIFWLVMPLILGCTAVAEERKLGVAEQQLCLPVTRCTLFSVKLIPTLIFGVLLGSVMPLVLETLAAHFGWPSEVFKVQDRTGNELLSGNAFFVISILTVSAGLTLVAIFASTLAKFFLQALSITIVTIIGCFLFGSFIAYIGQQRGPIFGIFPWPSALPVIVGIPTMVAAVLWLIYGNFSYFHESGRLWRRNIMGIVGALLFIFVSSSLIYNRAWEVFEPAEPAHRTAKFSRSNPPRLQGNYFGGLQVRLPDGRVWFDCLKGFYWDDSEREGPRKRPWRLLWRQLVRPLPKSIGPEQFMAGSNWMSASIARYVDFGSGEEQFSGYLDTIGVQANGSLWISSEAKPTVWTGAKMVQFGDESNWQQVISRPGGYLLTKSDGTLWQWRGATNQYQWYSVQTNWPSVRTFEPQQIGKDSRWQEISSVWGSIARTADGNIYQVNFNYRNNAADFFRQTNLDQIVPQTFSQGENRSAYVDQEGRLWIGNWSQDYRSEETLFGFVQAGSETNWVTTAIDQRRLVVLKADGSLWQWMLNTKSPIEALQISPKRFGIHDDWVGLTGISGGIVSLAADGSLWFWPGSDYDGSLLKSPKQPELLGNVFGKSD